MSILDDPSLWVDHNDDSPPFQWNAVEEDNRFWFTNNGDSSFNREVTYIGADELPATLSFGWEITIPPGETEGAVLLVYDIGAGAQTLDLGNGVGSGSLDIDLSSATGLSFYVTVENVTFAQYGAQAAISSVPETPTVSYNCDCDDETNYETLAQLRRRMLIRLGFATQADNPPPGMVDLLNEFLISAQKFLYEKYQALRNERFFSWTMEPGVRFYDIPENQEECTKRMDALKLTWVGLQDSNEVWLPMISGIPPEFYTSINRPGIPTRYEIRQCIEVFPAPDKAYTLWVKAKAQLEPFAADGDKTSIESELVFLWALANAKLHYGKPDADAIASQANQYLGKLTAGKHGTRRYIPGTRQIPALPKPIFLPLQGQNS